MTTASDADRATATELLWAAAHDQETDEAIAAIAAALAEARADAVERLTTDVRALAEELDGEARGCAEQAYGLPVGTPRRHGLLGLALGKKAAAARLRAVVADAGKPDTSSEEE